MSDRRSRSPMFLPKDRVAIGDRKINDWDRKKRDLFSDLNFGDRAHALVTPDFSADSEHLSVPNKRAGWIL